MNKKISRRTFTKAGAAVTLGLAASRPANALGANDQIRLGVIGVGGRGRSLVNTFAGHAYDALHIVCQALERAGECDRAKLRDEIEKTQEFVGTAGIFNYTPEDHNGLTVDAFVWVTIEDGQWKLAE